MNDDYRSMTKKEISFVTLVGAVVNSALVVIKGAFGYFAGSKAMMADAVHSLSDLVTDAAILIGVRYWTAPPDDGHPYGHRKIETMITLGIGLILAVVGITMGYEALLSLFRGAAAAQNNASETTAWIAFAATVTAIIAKELLYRWTAAKGIALKSSAVVANAWHHRSDALSSLPPAITLSGTAIGANMGYNLWFLDPVGTVVVCGMLVAAAWDISRPSLAALIDSSADRRLCIAIRRTVRATPGVLSSHKIRTRYVGPDAVEVDLHIMVDGNLSVTEGHDIASSVKHRIMALKVDKVSAHVLGVMVHTEPAKEFQLHRHTQTEKFP